MHNPAPGGLRHSWSGRRQAMRRGTVRPERAGRGGAPGGPPAWIAIWSRGLERFQTPSRAGVNDPMKRATIAKLSWLLLGFVAGCAETGPVNPSFSVSTQTAREALDEMRSHPVRLERPVVVLSGYLDPGLGAWWVGRALRKATGDERFLELQLLWHATFESCRTSVIDSVDEAFPSSDPIWTAEVDVVAISMGGLVARAAAAPPGENAATQRRLRIRRLFTISTPHRGASLAAMPCILPLHRDMGPGSRWLAQLEEDFGSAEYTVLPYVRLRDWTVGAENAAPPGMVPWWLSGSIVAPSHPASATDSRIHADIARRLRGEEAFARSPAAPLPAGS